jgi:Cu2+-exporting ATPase
MDHEHHHPSSIESSNNNKLSQSSPSHHTGHNQHIGHNVEMFRNKFWVCLIISIPVLLWDPMIQQWFKYQLPSFPGSNFIPAVFGTIVFIYGGWIFLQGAYQELVHKTPGMMTLISLAINVAFFYSIAVMLGLKGHTLWWELATLISIMLLGHWIEMRSISQAQGALQELAKLLPDTAILLTDDESTQEVLVEQLQEGDLILIRPGASIPADGMVQSGKSSVNEAMITGESKPVEKKQGERVLAGTVNGEGSLRVKIAGIGDKTALAGIMRLVEQAQSSRSRAQALADRAAFYLTLVAIGSGLITLIGWLLSGSTLDFAITRVVTVLVIACPHALGLAIPLVIAISTTLGARNGLLIRDRRGLEEARNLDVVVFDKTGTLTMGEHRVIQTVTDKSIDNEEALRLAAAVERDSEHPIARALQKSAEAVGIEIPPSQNFRAIPGQGTSSSRRS